MNITTRPFTNDEITALILKSNTPWKEIYFLAFYTGLRISDLMSLPWQPWPISYPIYEQKSKKTKLINFTELSRQYWNSLYNYGNKREYLFPFRDPSAYRKAIQRDCIRFDIDPYRIAFHSIRKTHAVLTYKHGGLLAANATLNHSNIKITQKYIENALRFDCGLIIDELFTPKTK